MDLRSNLMQYVRKSWRLSTGECRGILSVWKRWYIIDTRNAILTPYVYICSVRGM